MTRQFEGTENKFVYDSEAGYARLDKKYRAEGWGKITDASNVESQASDVAMWAHERITELEAKAEQAAALITSQAAEIERLRDTLTDAEKYLRHLLISFVREHFPDNTSWRPLDRDLIGMLTQMDNACTIARDYKDQIDAKDKALEPFAKVATVFDHQRLPAPCEDHHTVYTWATKATGEVEITVADFRAAHAALTTGAAHE